MYRFQQMQLSPISKNEQNKAANFSLQVTVHAPHNHGIIICLSTTISSIYMPIFSSSEIMAGHNYSVLCPKDGKNLRNLQHDSSDSKTYLMTRVSWSTCAISDVRENYFAVLISYPIRFTPLWPIKRMHLLKKVFDR